MSVHVRCRVTAYAMKKKKKFCESSRAEELKSSDENVSVETFYGTQQYHADCRQLKFVAEREDS